jgi:antitoxin ParD1/3/4
MDVKIGSRWKDVIAEAIESGRYASEEEVINEGLTLLADKERRLKELKALIDEAYEEEGTESVEDVIAAVDAALDGIRTAAE